MTKVKKDMIRDYDWIGKLHKSHGLPKIVKMTGKKVKKWGPGTMTVPAPIEVNELMKKVPKGKLVTVSEIREALAKKHKTTLTCPLTTGIFAWISAYASEQEKLNGKKDCTPYWRTLKKGGMINEKYPGGVEAQKKLLESEGHKVKTIGKKYLVETYEKVLVNL